MKNLYLHTCTEQGFGSIILMIANVPKNIAQKGREMYMKKDNWLVPEYFSSFSCKCGECRNACCKGWKIAVREEDYYRLIGMECSKALHEKIESAFGDPEVATRQRYKLIEPDWRGECRMLGEDGLCMLQKECGEAAIPEICRVYPRSYRETNGYLSAVCSTSCEKTVELLMDTEQIRFKYITMKNGIRPEITETLPIGSEETAKGCTDILLNRSKSLTERIFSVGSLLKCGELKQVTLNRLLNIIKELLETSDSLAEYAAETINRYGEGNGDAEKLYQSDFELFTEHYPKWSIYFENFMVNNVFYAAFPYCDERIRPEDAAYGLYLEYEILKLICTAYTVRDASDERFTDAVAAIYHLVEHTSFYYNAYMLLK